MFDADLNGPSQWLAVDVTVQRKSASIVLVNMRSDIMVVTTSCFLKRIQS